MVKKFITYGDNKYLKSRKRLVNEVKSLNLFDEYYDDVFISLTCSGTASLEIAKRNIPQIVIYKLNFYKSILSLIKF